MSFFSGIGKLLKKVAPIALPLAASFIPGVGPAVAGAMGSVGSLFGGGAAEPAVPGSGPAYSSPGPGGVQQLPQATVSGSRPWDIPWGAIGALGSGALSYYGQQQTNAANAQQAQQQMAFQNQQTSTSYQRGVADMQAAGLNPMLAYSQGGASSGSGASAQMGNSVGAGVSSALQSAQTVAQVENIGSQTDKTRADTVLSLLSADKLVSDTDLSTAQAARTRAETQRATAQLVSDIAAGQVDKASVGPRISRERSESAIRGYEVPRARNIGEAQDSWWMRNIAPYLSSAGQAGDLVGSTVRRVVTKGR